MFHIYIENTSKYNIVICWIGYDKQCGWMMLSPKSSIEMMSRRDISEDVAMVKKWIETEVRGEKDSYPWNVLPFLNCS